VIFASCTDEIDPVTPSDSTDELERDTDIKVLEYKEMGELHNQVLKNLNRKMPLLNNKVQADSFVKNFLDSTNEVLEKNGYINRLTKRDVLWLLKKFIELKEENIIDFFKLPKDIPLNSLNRLAEKGCFPKCKLGQYIRVFEDVKEKGKKSAIFKEPGNLLSHSAEEGFFDNYTLFVDVTKNSYKFWYNLHESSSSDSMMAPEKIKALQTMYWDASGTLCGGLLGLKWAGPYGGLIGGFAGLCLASTAFIIWGDDFEDWADDQLDEYF